MLVFDFYHRLGVKNREVRLHNLMLASDGTRPVLKISDFEYSKTEQVHGCCSPMKPRYAVTVAMNFSSRISEPHECEC